MGRLISHAGYWEARWSAPRTKHGVGPAKKGNQPQILGCSREFQTHLMFSQSQPEKAFTYMAACCQRFVFCAASEREMEERVREREAGEMQKERERDVTFH